MFHKIIHHNNHDSESESDYYGGRTATGTKNIIFEQLATAITEHHYKDFQDFVNFDSLLEEHSKIVINMSLEDYPNLRFKKSLEEQLYPSLISHKKAKI